jgi:hypothetical protein
MDTSLYSRIRTDVARRLELEVERASEMEKFVDNLAGYLQSISGQNWTVCHLGTWSKDGAFLQGRPEIEARTHLPFAMKIHFSDPEEENLPGFHVVVRFDLSWQGRVFTLHCLHTGKSFSFNAGDSSTRSVLAGASELLDQPVQDRVDVLLRV